MLQAPCAHLNSKSAPLARSPFRGKMAEALAFQSRFLDELHHTSRAQNPHGPVEQLFPRRSPARPFATSPSTAAKMSLELNRPEYRISQRNFLDSLPKPLMHIGAHAVDHVRAAYERLASRSHSAETMFFAPTIKASIRSRMKDDGRGQSKSATIRKHAVEKGPIQAADVVPCCPTFRSPQFTF